MPRKRSPITTKRVAIGVAMAAMFGLGGLFCSNDSAQVRKPADAMFHSVSNTFTPTPAFAMSPSKTGSGEVSLADVAEKAVPSVVNIYAERMVSAPDMQNNPLFQDPFFRHFFGGGGQMAPQDQVQKSLGSGVVVNKQGFILTNNHVIEHATELKVIFKDGSRADAKIVGADPKTDIAVIRVKDHKAELHPITIGDSSRLRLGDVVLAIGDPFGVGQTVTMGIISATGRANMGLADYEDFIQTDAAINPGNSGGALVNMQGQLIGINTAILSHSGGNNGIGFAIPSNMAATIMKSLIEHGKVVRGWLGVAIQDLNPDLAKAMKLSTEEGVLVSDVSPDSPAAKAGLKRGDVIVGLNGQKETTSAALRSQIASLGKGAVAKLEILRDNQRKTIDVTLGELPNDGSITGGKVVEGNGPLGGLQLEGLSKDNRTKYNIPDRVKAGVVVTGVKNGSVADQTGLQPGDVIVEVNRQPVQSLAQFDKLYKSKGSLLILVYRKGSTMYLLLDK